MNSLLISNVDFKTNFTANSFLKKERQKERSMSWPITAEKLWRLALSNAWQIIKPIFIESTLAVGGSVIPNCFTSENENK